MRLSKIILLIGATTAMIVVGVTIFIHLFFPQNQTLGQAAQPTITTTSHDVSQAGQAVNSGSAFLPESGSPSLSENSNASQPKIEVFQGKPISSIGDVATIVAEATSSIVTPDPTSTTSLSLPNIPDTDVVIDPSGVSTQRAYLSYFNEHAPSGIVFDNRRFAGVLKDKNGVMLFPQQLINKAVTDNNFEEVHDSLVIEKDFITAEISFLKSIKVTGDAVALNKETIGVEELLSEEVDKALAVGSGETSLEDLLSFRTQFSALVQNDHAKLLASSGVLSIASPQSWFDRLVTLLGAKAKAEDGVDTPFGGPIGVPVLCTCDAGYYIIVGEPSPADLFVPIAFLATPLFYNDHSTAPGAYWLGTYDENAEVPCLVGAPPYCSSAGEGGSIVMAGTGGI